MLLLVYSIMDEINISDHFLERFNQRYLYGQNNPIRNKEELRGYLKAIFSPSALSLLEKRKNYSKNSFIWMGKDHSAVVKNNNMVTVKYKDYNLYLEREVNNK